jgi:hypothetical protein
MEVYRKVNTRRFIESGSKVPILEPVEPNEGFLILGLRDDNYIEIEGGIRIYLDHIQQAAGNNRSVKLIFVADRNLGILRRSRLK